MEQILIAWKSYIFCSSDINCYRVESSRIYWRTHTLAEAKGGPEDDAVAGRWKGFSCWGWMGDVHLKMVAINSGRKTMRMRQWLQGVKDAKSIPYLGGQGVQMVWTLRSYSDWIRRLRVPWGEAKNRSPWDKWCLKYFKYSRLLNTPSPTDSVVFSSLLSELIVSLERDFVVVRWTRFQKGGFLVGGNCQDGIFTHVFQAQSTPENSKCYHHKNTLHERRVLAAGVMYKHSPIAFSRGDSVERFRYSLFCHPPLPGGGYTQPPSSSFLLISPPNGGVPFSINFR